MSVLLLEIKNETNSIEKSNIFNVIKYSTSEKFKNDKVNFENDRYHVLLDGVVLNKNAIMKGFNMLDWTQCLLNLYEDKGKMFFDELKGSYYGFIYDKQLEKFIVFSDHIGSKPLYFSECEQSIVFSNSYTEIVQYLKSINQQVTLSDQSAYLILSYGYVFEELTITNEIKRLLVGHYAEVQHSKLRIDKFFTLSNKPVNISEEEAIDELDKRFRVAVKNAFDKDLEYGYKHAVALSGGLDSRMTSWVANDLGYTNQINFTFSQSDYLDETIAKKIAIDLGHEWMFKALDHGLFLKNIDKTNEISGGNVLYYGLAHGLSLYDYINFNDLGIMHSGQLGDVVISSFYNSKDRVQNYHFGDGAYSQKLLSKVAFTGFKKSYANEEIFKIYIRGFYGANQGLLGVMNYTETYSPFYDIEFMEFSLSLPLELRFKHNIYKKWIMLKYPKAADYVWEAEKVPVNYRYWVRYKKAKVALSQIPALIASKFGIKKYGLDTKNNMNPLDFWMYSNPELKKYQDNYFQDNIMRIVNNKELLEDCKHLYNTGSAIEKNLVLTLLSAVKILGL